MTEGRRSPVTWSPFLGVFDVAGEALELRWRRVLWSVSLLSQMARVLYSFLPRPEVVQRTGERVFDCLAGGCSLDVGAVWVSFRL